MKRFELCRVSYWVLFVIIPTVLLTYCFKLGVSGVAVFIIFVVIGTQLFRYWKKLWRISDNQE